MENNYYDSKILKILHEIKSTLIIFLILLSIIFVINAFIARIVRVEGHSMDPTLHNGQVLVMDKLTYRFRDPKRFEIVIFPHDDKLFIKRVIGLPGETVQIKEGEFYINNKKLDYDPSPFKVDPSMYGRAIDPVKLGPDEYFCVGDNRNHSGDSRLIEVGNVHRDQFRGRAIFRLLPFGKFGFIKNVK